MNILELQKLIDEDLRGSEARSKLKTFVKDAYDVLQEMKSVSIPLSHIDRIYDDGSIAFQTEEDSSGYDLVWVHSSELEKFFLMYHDYKEHEENLTRNIGRIEAKIKKHFGDFANNSPIYFVRSSFFPGNCTITVGTSKGSFVIKIKDGQALSRKKDTFKLTSEVEFEFTTIDALDDLFVQAKQALNYTGGQTTGPLKEKIHEYREV